MLYQQTFMQTYLLEIRVHHIKCEKQNIMYFLRHCHNCKIKIKKDYNNYMKLKYCKEKNNKRLGKQS